MSTNIEDEEELANWLGGYEEPMKMGGRPTKSKKHRQRGGSSRTVNDLSDEIFIKTVQVLKDMGANGSNELDDRSSRLDILQVLKNQMKLQTFMEWAIPRYTAFLDDIRKRAGVEHKRTFPMHIQKIHSIMQQEKQPFLFQHMWCMNLVLIVFGQHNPRLMDEHFKVLTQSIHETSACFHQIHPIFSYLQVQPIEEVSSIFHDFLSWCPIAWPCKQPGVMQTTYLKYMFYNLDENGNPPSAVFHILPIFAEELNIVPHGHSMQVTSQHIKHDIEHFEAMRRLFMNPTRNPVSDGIGRLSWQKLRQHLNFILAPITNPIHKAVQMFCSLLMFRAFHEVPFRVHVYWEEYFDNSEEILFSSYVDGYAEMIYITACIMPLIQFAAKKCDKTLINLLEPYVTGNYEHIKLSRDAPWFSPEEIEIHYEQRVKPSEERLLTKIFPDGKRMQLSEVHVHKFKPVMECILHHHPEILNDNQFLWNAQNKASLTTITGSHDRDDAWYISSPSSSKLSTPFHSPLTKSPGTPRKRSPIQSTKSQRKTKRSSIYYPTIFTKRRRSTTKRFSK